MIVGCLMVRTRTRGWKRKRSNGLANASEIPCGALDGASLRSSTTTHSLVLAQVQSLSLFRMNLLDLLKVNRSSSKYRRMCPRVASDVVYDALCDIRASMGWCRLCRGLGPNVAVGGSTFSCASSLSFLFT